MCKRQQVYLTKFSNSFLRHASVYALRAVSAALAVTYQVVTSIGVEMSSQWLFPTKPRCRTSAVNRPASFICSLQKSATLWSATVLVFFKPGCSSVNKFPDQACQAP